MRCGDGGDEEGCGRDWEGMVLGEGDEDGGAVWVEID